MSTYLKLAREAAGLTQKEVAEELGIAAPDLSRWERGLRPLPDHWVGPLASHYGVVPGLLRTAEPIVGPMAGAIHHRAYKSIPAATKRKIDARAMMHARAVMRLLDGVELDVPFHVPAYDVDPERAATLVRASWRLPTGPIDNLVAVLERAGVVVVAEPFATDRIVGMSLVHDDRAFVMVVNTDCPWDRIRFTLAHELGHMVMHRDIVDEHLEEEANAFASHFLMPDDDIAPYLAGRTITWGYLMALKPEWRVSGGALLQKAKSLGAISERQYVSVRKFLARTGQQRHEPNPLAPERPTLLREITEVQHETVGSWKAVADIAGTWLVHKVAREYAELPLAPAS